MSLNYTPLRHKMLAAIGKGRVSVDPGDRVRCAVMLRTTQTQITRAFNWIEDEFLIEKTLYADRRQFATELTARGRVLLAEWTGRHGEPK